MAQISSASITEHGAQPLNSLRQNTNGFARILALAAFALATSPLGAQAQTSPVEIVNLSALVRPVQYRVQQIQAQRGWSSTWTGSRPIRLAILDNGFRGLADEIGRTLPRSRTVLRPGPVAIDPRSEESHGTMMARIVAEALAQTAPEIPVQLHLFSAFGFSNFQAAVDSVIRERFDLVLYAQVWEFGGNGDGRGFINAEVRRAIDAGILWINAAGNFGDATYQSRIVRGRDDWATLPGPNSSVRLRCPQSAQQGRCQVRAVLSWNSFSDSTLEGTDKDLDLIATDDTGNIITSSALRQKRAFPEGEPGSSLYPREIVSLSVPPGVVQLRVKIRSSEWSSRDRLRITVSGSEFELIDRTEGETLLPPADLPGVLVVGATDSSRSSRSISMDRPQLSFVSRVDLSDGAQTRGTSNTAALTAALAVIEIAARGETIQAQSLVRSLQRLSSPLAARTSPTDPPAATPKVDCLQPRPLPRLHEAARQILQRGGAVSGALRRSGQLAIWRSRSAGPLPGGVELMPSDGTTRWVATADGLVQRSQATRLGSEEYLIVEEVDGWRVCPFN
jgi:hypothetical protein